MVAAASSVSETKVIVAFSIMHTDHLKSNHCKALTEAGAKVVKPMQSQGNLVGR